MAKSLSQIAINDFSGGIIYDFSGYKDGADNQYSQARGFSPLIGTGSRRYGALNSGYGYSTFSDTTSKVTSKIVSMSFNQSDQFTALQDNGYLVSYHTGNFQSSYLATGAVVGWEVIDYSYNVSGSLGFSLCYTYDTATTSYFGTIRTDFGHTTGQSDTLGTLTYGVPHRMLTGEDGTLYITNGNYIATYEGTTGTNGTFNATALKLASNMIAVGFANYYGNLMILCNTGASYNYIGKSYVIPFEFGSSLSKLKYELTEGNATAILADDRNLYVFSNGDMQSFDGYAFQTLYRNIGSPTQNQVFLYNNTACWVKDFVGIMGYGQANASKGLHCTSSVYPVSGGVASGHPQGTLYYVAQATSLQYVDTTKNDGTDKYWISKNYQIMPKSVLKYIYFKFNALDETLSVAIQGISNGGIADLYTFTITKTMLENGNMFRLPLNVEANKFLITINSDATKELSIDEITVLYESGAYELAGY